MTSAETLVLEGPTSDDDWVVIVHAVKQAWPEAIIRRNDHGDATFYRDQQAFRRALEFRGRPGERLGVRVLPDAVRVTGSTAEEGFGRLGRAVIESLASSRG